MFAYDVTDQGAKIDGRRVMLHQCVQTWAPLPKRLYFIGHLVAAFFVPLIAICVAYGVRVYVDLKNKLESFNQTH